VLADEFAPAVVAVPGVDEHLDGDEGTACRRQDEDLGVLEAATRPTRPGPVHAGGDDLVIEQPARQIDLANGGVRIDLAAAQGPRAADTLR